jgi:hypothetical protein
MRHSLLAPAALAAILVALPAIADDKTECIAASEKAQQLRDEHKLTQAREKLLSCGREVCPGPVKKDCAEQLADLDRKMPSVVIRAKDKAGNDAVAVKVSADGMPLGETLDGRAIPIDPGVHTFRFEMAGAEPIEQKVVVAEGEQNRTVMASFGGVGEAPGGKSSFPVAGVVVGGLGLVAGVIAPIFWSMGLSEKSDLEGTCAPPKGAGCTDSQISSVRTKLAIGDVFLGVGIVGVAVGTVLIVTHSTGGPKSTGAAAPLSRMAAAKPFFDVAPLQGGAFASGGFKF